MIPGMNPRKMQQMMKKMGMQQVDIDATQVIIKTPEKNLIFDNPSIAKVNMMGQETYQLVGEYREEPISVVPEISDDDVKTVVEQTGANEDDVRKVLEENNGDLADAIMRFSEES